MLLGTLIIRLVQTSIVSSLGRPDDRDGEEEHHKDQQRDANVDGVSDLQEEEDRRTDAHQRWNASDDPQLPCRLRPSAMNAPSRSHEYR